VFSFDFFTGIIMLNISCRLTMKTSKIIIVFLALVFLGVVLFVSYDSLFNTKPETDGNDKSISVAELIELVLDNTEKHIYGEVIIKEDKTVSLHSGGESIDLILEKDMKVNMGSWFIATGTLTEKGKFLVSDIGPLESDIHDEFNYFDEEAVNDSPIIAGSVCKTDTDCVHFGKTGDCNCGCYHKEETPADAGGACFCQAPTSCACIKSTCEGVFE